jgi:hypothetical protein
MRVGKRFLTDCELSGVRYIFESLERGLSDEECHEALAKYFETHGHRGEFHRRLRQDKFMMIDCRPAFRKPLADVTPKLSTTFMPYTERSTLIFGLIVIILFYVLLLHFFYRLF